MNEPTKADIDSVFKRLRAVSTNKVCFDCHSKNPTWSSITYGVFICLDCSAIHRSLGVHLSFVRSTQLDTNWTWLQLRNMQVGGNANANKFFHQHNCTSTDAQQKYNSRAAQLYREKINKLAQQAMRIHGTNISIDSHPEPGSPEVKEIDFFEEHANCVSLSPPRYDSHNFLRKEENANISNGSLGVESVGPSIDSVLTVSADKTQQPKKSTIGQRKPASKVGGKKGGLGAQRVKKDFATIEKEAAKNDQLRFEEKNTQLTKEEQEKSLVSLQEAYESMGLASKREEARMKKVDPKKAEQAERLGMGLGSRSAVSHSLFEEMKTIEQEAPSAKFNNALDVTRSSGGTSHRAADIDDDFDTVIRFSTGPPKYKDSPFEDVGFSGFGGRGSGIDDLLSDSSKSSSSNWENEFEKIDAPPSSSSSSSAFDKISASANYKYTPVDDRQAQQKFGNAKAISSDMFFRDRDPDSEVRSNLAKFEGSSAISSSDLFGTQQSTRRGGGSSIQAPDLDDVRESVKQGVTKVAGRLSNLATNVMSTIQDRYT